MNQSTTESMDDTDVGLQAELEEWRLIRRGIRWRLSRVTLLAWFYITAALASGVYLLNRVATLIRTITVDSFVDEDLLSEWSEQSVALISWTYLVIAVLLLLLFLFTTAYIHDRLPASLQVFGSALPGIGGCISSNVLGEFWASLYRATEHQETPATALRLMERESRNASVKHWAHRSADRLDEGTAFHQALQDLPVSDGSDQAAAAILEETQANRDLPEICQRTATLCHQLAVSRTARTVQLVSLFSILISAGVAGIALASVLYTTYQMIEVFIYW
ncbi:MAG: type II secretion system F family protein [Planctomycetota bacterium]